MIVTILEIRARIIRFAQKFQIVLLPLLRFLVAFVVFRSINNAIGREPHLMSLPVELLLSFLGTFTPPVILVLLGAFVSLAHVFFASPILAILVAVIMFILYCFIARFSGKYGYVVLAVPILFLLNIPYTVPLVLGLLATPLTIIPTTCGIIIYRVFLVTGTAMEYESSMGINDILQLYINVIDQLLADKQMLITIAVFSVIIICMYLIRKLSIEYIFEISVAMGTIICILGFLIANIVLPTGMNITSMVFGSLGSMVIALLVQFFRLALDYTAVERVQFEDDDYLYYVRAVPKINLTVPKRRVKKISSIVKEKSVKAEEVLSEEELPAGEEEFLEEKGKPEPDFFEEEQKSEYADFPDDGQKAGYSRNDALNQEAFSDENEPDERELSKEERYALGEEFFEEDELDSKQ